VRSGHARRRPAKALRQYSYLAREGPALTPATRAAQSLVTRTRLDADTPKAATGTMR
jgi:hypothetical protein